MKVFLSYSQRDKLFADKLRPKLATAGFTVWDDSVEIFPGENWARKTGEALEKSDAMVVLLSPEAVKSRSVRHEIEYALGSSRYQKRLIPVMVRRTKEIPWILHKMRVLRSSDPEQAARRIVRILKKRESPQAQNAR